MGRPNRFTRTDQVAEYLSEEMPIAEIADRMGMSRKYIDMVTYRIRKTLGPQAR